LAAYRMAFAVALGENATALASGDSTSSASWPETDHTAHERIIAAETTALRI
jgi:hypothetical protein